jgi:Major Facilitator Superfamily
MSPTIPSERTPLLHEHGTDRLSRDEITRTHSVTHWLAPEVDENVEIQDETHNDDHEPDSPFFGNYTTTGFWFLYSPILLVYFVATFDSTLMASSHPVITSYFHSSNAASWLSTVFLLTSTAFQPLFGRVSDTIGRRPLYVFSLVMFIATTIWCALAQSIGSFIAARAFCGLGAGGVMAMVVTIHFPLPQNLFLTLTELNHYKRSHQNRIQRHLPSLH